MAEKNIALPLGRGAILLFVLLPFALCYDVCDVGECSSTFKMAFSTMVSRTIDSFCGDIGQVLKCLNDCHQVFFPYHLDFNSTVLLLNEVCDKEFVYDISDHWECIRQHLNRYLMCIARSSSIESSRNNGKIIACRKTLMMFECSEDVFTHHCDNEAVEIISQKFKDIFKPLFNSSCYGIPQNKVYNLDLKFVLNSDLDATADCLDSNTDLAEDCLSEYLEKAAHSEHTHCWTIGDEEVCNNPTSSIPCSPVSSVANFYSSLFSFGKQNCIKNSTYIFKSKMKTEINAKTGGFSQKDLAESNSSTQIMLHSSSSENAYDPVDILDKEHDNKLNFGADQNVLQTEQRASSHFPLKDNTGEYYSSSDSPRGVTFPNTLINATLSDLNVSLSENDEDCLLVSDISSGSQSVYLLKVSHFLSILLTMHFFIVKVV